LSRRRLLAGIGSASASTLLAGCGGGSGEEPAHRPSCSQEPRPLEIASAACAGAPFEALVREIVDTPRDRIFEAMAVRLRAGVELRALLAADFHAAVRGVTPSANGVIHSLLVVNSVNLVGAATDARLRLAAVLWAIDNFKGEQGIRQTPLPPADEARIPGAASDARDLLTAGLDAFDPDDADAGAAGMARSAERAELVDLLLRYSARDGGDAHRQIAPVQCFRSLDAFGWECAEPALRFVARLLAEGSPGVDTTTFESSVALAGRGIALHGTSGDLSWVRELLAQSRTDTSVGLRDAAGTALTAGLSPDALWDGLLAASAEVVLRGNGGSGLHRFDATNAMRWAIKRARAPELRSLLLLQAAALIPPTRVEGTAWRNPPPFREVNIDSLSSGTAPVELETLFGRGGDGRAFVDDVTPAEDALAWLGEGGSVCEYLTRARELVVMKGQVDAHFVKFPAAVFEEIERVDPFWVPRLLATELLVNPSPISHDDWPHFDEALALAAELGL
jgi:hypothetical protein